MSRIARTGPPFGEEQSFRLLKQAVIARTGHYYYEDKDALLWERVAKRLKATGAASIDAYVERLAGRGGEAEWNALEAEITIGETFFFRFVEQFAALRTKILPDIIARNRESRQIRIWSAGCSTGAEAYSVAIVLRELLGEAIADWRVGIVGTDINESFLEAARRGVYGKWALRSTNPVDRERWFTAPGPDGPWTVRPAYRGLAHFERHNLMSLLDGTSPLQFTGFDLILCRNVLIYFHTDAVTRIVHALGDCLAADGWMLIGHAESHPDFTRSLALVELPGAIAYRRRSEHADAAAPQADVAEPPAFPQSAAQPSRATVRAGAERPSARRTAPPLATIDKVAQHHPAGSDLVAVLRAKADEGDVEGALGLVRAGLKAAPTDPVLFYYQGLLDQAGRRSAEAERAFRSAIYLDGSFVMAHYQLGLLLTSCGEIVAGRRALTAAARLAAGLPPERELAEGDGLTAGVLARLARATLQPMASAR
ncbi:protein-glutamate O-methyltransferase [Alsobacter metallidurans]|uniref:protein-glutamate O-methyltransferase n=1 Tax=Alsobacter metallidurans TaxID=340221 RepID=A0A917I426_9HYPH|nr:protein-glutamate O-methyltransferase CheR [Alsobacter metallidurans]GGH06177.1 protein-glutamate O-methyltransferase [Alsobacter metallidurans]